ncbi:CBS domain-containing protein [bacterium CPR1]|nr:CBS domain-containing protein [bacterium CPR1]
MISPHLPPIQSRLGETPLQVSPVHAAGPPTPLQLGQVYKQIVLTGRGTGSVEKEQEEPPILPRPRPLRRTWRTVADVMHREVLTVPTTMTVAELAQFLAHHRISGAPVLDAEDRLVGVISVTDVNAYAGHSWARIPPPQERCSPTFYESTAFTLAVEHLDASVEVGKIMSPYVYFATEDSDLMELVDLMIEQHIHRLMVLDEQEQLVGIVTSLDVMKAMRDELSIGR